MRARRAGWTIAAGVAAPLAVAAVALGATLPRDAAPAETTVELAPVVASWPSGFAVTGTKSEPLYTERIEVTRDGDAFSVDIELLSQGDRALGSQTGTVEVSPSGAVAWTSGCVKSAAECADDPALRGFLATAALVGLERRGLLPADGTVRSLHGTSVVCVDDALLHPTSPAAIVPLDPCFDLGTGAVLGHWSAASAAFVGATLADGFAVASRPTP